jgi:hypothetical protein
MTDHDDELAWHLIGGLPASEREHSIKAVGEGRGYPLVRSEKATRPRVRVDRPADPEPRADDSLLVRTPNSSQASPPIPTT